jgi:threonine synthase
VRFPEFRDRSATDSVAIRFQALPDLWIADFAARQARRDFKSLENGVAAAAFLRDTLSSVRNVTDADVRLAMRAAAQHLKLVLEPSGASALASALTAQSRGLGFGQRVGVICSGGNIAPDEFVKILGKPT